MRTIHYNQVVADFRGCQPGTAVILRNAADFLNNEDYKFTDRVMRFDVQAAPSDLSDAGQPAKLSHEWDDPNLDASLDNPPGGAVLGGCSCT